MEARSAVRRNRYSTRFFISALVAFTLYAALVAYVVGWRQDLHNQDLLNTKYVAIIELTISTFVFVLVIALCVPLVYWSILETDESVWKNRMLHIHYLRRAINLRDSQAIAVDREFSSAADVTYKKFQETMLESKAKNLFSQGLFLTQDEFDTWLQVCLGDLDEKCQPNSAQVGRTLARVNLETQHMARLTNRWYLQTNVFLVVFGVLCAAALSFSFFFFVKACLAAFPLWFDIPSSYKALGYLPQEYVREQSGLFAGKRCLKVSHLT